MTSIDKDSFNTDERRRILIDLQNCLTDDIDRLTRFNKMDYYRLFSEILNCSIQTAMRKISLTSGEYSYSDLVKLKCYFKTDYNELFMYLGGNNNE